MSDICDFCASTKLRVAHQAQYHKVDRTFGPFDLYRCQQCGSLGTCNKPSLERLAEFYRHYDEFRPSWYNAASENAALNSQYKFYANFLMRQFTSGTKTWVDIGAGHGEVATLISRSRPDCSGLAVDIGSRPETLPSEVAYGAVDLNAPGWLHAIGRQFDFVFSVAVWEHVLSPLDFAKESLSLVAPGGTLIMITPDYGSIARRLLGRRWPYFEPGEHLSIPTRHGATLCVSRAASLLKIETNRYKVHSRAVMVGYSLSYLSSVLRLKILASSIPPDLAAPLPTGILATVVKRL